MYRLFSRWLLTDPLHVFRRAMVSIELPVGYGFVVLCNFVAPALFMTWAGGRAGSSRKRTGVALPAMQAWAGMPALGKGRVPIKDEKTGKPKTVTEEQALEFNCLQRGHYNPLESISDFRFMSAVAGLLNPYVTAAAGVAWLVGYTSYALGYDGKLGRCAFACQALLVVIQFSRRSACGLLCCRQEGLEPRLLAYPCQARRARDEPLPGCHDDWPTVSRTFFIQPLKRLH